MFRHLLLFDWKFYIRKVSFYVMLFAFWGFGFMTGTSAIIPFPNITLNSPYAINFFLGLFSLASLIPIVLMTSQSLLREKDNQFEQILYTTPITISSYIISRFSLVFGVAVFTSLLFLIGYILGHLIVIDNSERWGIFHLSYYLHCFFAIVLPNIFLCTAIVCCTAWFSKNRMLVYLSGLGVYILYMIVSLFSNSPFMAGSSPVSDKAMNLAAKLDPFGMAAFFEQTQYWTAIQRNSNILEFSGNFLLNRIGVILLALILLIVTYNFYKFKITSQKKKKIAIASDQESKHYVYNKTATQLKGNGYFISTILSFLKIDLKSTIKSIPFVVLVVLTLFMHGMEMHKSIDGGIRLPQYYVTTALMINAISTTLPILLLFAMLFYGSELVWKSKNIHFSSIENTTPFSNVALFISKFVTVFFISILLTFFCITLGIIFQIFYNYPIIDFTAFLSLFYYIGLPASLCGLLIIALQYIFKNKYIALVITAIFLAITNNLLGNGFGFSHPLTRFANFMPDVYSDITSFSYFSKAFIIKMLYSFSFALLLSIMAIIVFEKSVKKVKLKSFQLLILPLIALFLSGFLIAKNYHKSSKADQLTWQQQYEEKYKLYQKKPQPTITDVKTTIELFPKKNSYTVKGNYVLVNKTQFEITEILISTSNEISWNAITSSQLILEKKDVEFGQYLFKTKQTMSPNDSIAISFDFEYKIEPINNHQSFNAIVENGSFMRISNYFPKIGYNLENEIGDELERKNRNMRLQDALTKIDAPLENPYNYEFINFDAIISTEANQTAISVGDLVDNYSKNNRNYFHYKAENIPFRFAVSSAEYAIQKSKYNGINIELFYEPKHNQNISHLMKSIRNTMQYCETNFGKYPYKTIRFAEISSYTKGFAGTAYPASVFINEKQFHIKLDQKEGFDIINELAGHELSHQWWGNAQLNPDYREGSGLLTETLAQYTRLMMHKKERGENKMLEMVNLYKNMYDSEKAFSGEEALFNSSPSNANVIYNKGLVKMYELYLLIGEEKINLALKNLLAKYKFPFQPATSLNLVEEFKLVSDKNEYKKIEDLFKK